MKNQPNKTHKNAKQKNGGMRVLMSRAAQIALQSARGLTSYKSCVLLLLALVTTEMCMLGIGVVRKLENSYHLAMEAARMELALLEAQELADTQLNEGSAGIAADESAGTAPNAEQPSSAAPNTPPPLRPRDVATIVAQETGSPISTAPTLSTPDQNDTEQKEEQAPPNETQVQTNDTAKKEEADRLIRQGVSALTAGDMRLCILSLEQALTLTPEHPALLYYYGLAYDKLLNPTKAREYYTKVFRMRHAAGKYFQRASRRLTYGFEQPSALRGKLSFGPHQVHHTYSTEQGEQVDILLPILLAPGEEVRPDDIYITIQFFDLVNGRTIAFSRNSPKLSWQNEKPTWEQWEENLLVSYNIEPPTHEITEAYGELKYYGFTAKLYYKGEPLDCISTPSALILHEQRLNSRRKPTLPASGLFPDDGLTPEEEAVPFSDFLEETAPPAS